jgi:hypothetical protein
MWTTQEKAHTVIDWRRVPLSLWAICALLLFEALAITVAVSGPVILVALTVPVALTWCFFLLKGVRWLWFATVLVSVLAVPGAVFGPASWRIVLTLIGLLLLLLSSTRAYFSISKSKDRP